MSLLSPEQLVAKGYRRTSDRYGILARVDREDWKEVLEKHLGRELPENYEFSADEGWADIYRRTLSQDTVQINPELAQQVPSSLGDLTGYIEPKHGRKGA
jgi:hypothetical protein